MVVISVGSLLSFLRWEIAARSASAPFKRGDSQVSKMGNGSEVCFCPVQGRRLTGCYCGMDSRLSGPFRCEHRQLFCRGWRTNPAQLDGIFTQAIATPWSHRGKAPGPQLPELAENSKDPFVTWPDAFFIFTWNGRPASVTE